jgi:hypothetical protein
MSKFFTEVKLLLDSSFELALYLKQRMGSVSMCLNSFEVEVKEVIRRKLEKKFNLLWEV